MSNSILFVDSSISDIETLLVNLAPDTEIQFLDNQADGVLQMAAVLKNRVNLDSIHIVSHGSRGVLSLGIISLNNNNLDDYADALKQIGAALTANGDILLYGCEVAQGTQGLDFIHKLAEITGADVAASTNLTGNVALSGDWILEANTGAIEENILQVVDYEGILASKSGTLANLMANSPNWVAGDNLTVMDATGSTLTAANLVALRTGKVAGSVNVTNAVTITGTQAQLTAALVTTATKATAATAAVTISDASTLTQLAAIDAKTTGTLTYTAITDIAANYASTTGTLTPNATTYLTGAVNAIVSSTATVAQANAIAPKTTGIVTINISDSRNNINSADFTINFTAADVLTLTSTSTSSTPLTLSVAEALLFDNINTGTGSAPLSLIDAGSVTAADLNAIDAATSALVNVSANTITGTAAQIDAVATAIGNGTVTAANFSATPTGTLTVAQANNIDAHNNAGIITATISDGSMSSLKTLTTTGAVNAYTVTVTDPTVAAVDLTVIDTVTSVAVNAAAVTSITGTAAQIDAVATAIGNGTITAANFSATPTGILTVAQANNIDAHNGTGIITATFADTAANLKGLTGTGNAYTVNLSAGSALATDLTAIDNATTVPINASAITTLTGTAADVTTVYNSSGITGLGNEAVTLSDTTLAASVLINLDALTTGLIDASTVTSITGTAADIMAVYTSSGITGFGNPVIGTAGNDTLTGSAGKDNIIGDAGNDLITGDMGADTLTGGGGVDIFSFAAGDSTLSTPGTGTGGTLTGNDVITDFRLGETLKFSSATVATAITGTTPSTLQLHTNATVKSHSITNGIITFSDTATFSAVQLTTPGDIAAVTQYLQSQSHSLGAFGKTVAFTATIGGVTDTYVYIPGMTASSDVLVDVKNVSTTGITAAANQISLFAPPAITSIAENSGGGINAAEASDGTPVVVNLTHTGAIAGDTLTINWGSQSFAYTVQASDISSNSATVTVPAATLSAQGDGTFNVSAKITDAILNASVASAAFPVTVDITAPTVTLSSSATAVKIGETATITATFSEAPVGFTVDDFTSTAGAFSGFAVDNTNPKIYTAIFTPTAGSSATDSAITIAAGSYTDVAGNVGEAGAKPTLAMDMLAPTAPTDSDATANAVPENASNATVVGLTVHSTDANGVAYSLSDNAGGRFAINSATGVVTVANGNLLNYEENTRHTVTAVATDQAGNSASQTFTIGIINVDEVAPSFTSGNTATPINENSGARQVVYTAASTDTTDYVSGTTTYSLKAVGDAAAFSVNDATGEITLTGNPNYGIKNSYALTVVATDAAGNAAEQAVALAINDLNEAIIYSATTFSEAAANDGSISTTSTLTLTNETFAKNVGDALGSVTNVPAGLTAHLVKTTANTATLSFTGKAAAHKNINNINNLTVTFADADFSGGATAGISGATKSNLVIDFADPLPVVVPPVTPINHAPTGTVTIAGTAQIGQTLTAENTLADADGLGAITYQWKIGNTLNPIKSNTYIQTVADLGKTITVTASYTDGLGKVENVDSSVTPAVMAAPIVVPPTPTPVITPVVTPPVVTPTPASVVVAPVDNSPAPIYDDPSPAPIIPAIPSTFTVDGVTVQQHFTSVYGAQVGHFSTPPVTSTRVEDYRTAHRQAADIPLGLVNKNAGVALALPTGVGFQADGVTGQQYLYTAFSQLSDDTKTALGAESSACADGQRFLLKFSPPTLNQPFFEQKIVLSYDSKTDINQPVIIDGTHSTLIPILNTFVIDASALPKDSVLALQHVDFAAIKGEVTVKLDPTSNVVHLGSTETPQSVFAYAGDDVLQVDSGPRMIHGGLGTDTVKVAGNLADYQVNQAFAVVTLTSLTNSADVQTLVNVEKVQFADQAVTFSFDDGIKAIAGTYQQMFGRQADLNGLQFWADAIKNKDLSLGQMAVFFMHSEEQLQKIGFDISQAAMPTQVEQFYQSFLGRAFDPVGKAFWVDKLTSGALNLTDLATTMIQSAEMQNHYAAPVQWDFSL